MSKRWKMHEDVEIVREDLLGIWPASYMNSEDAAAFRRRLYRLVTSGAYRAIVDVLQAEYDCTKAYYTALGKIKDFQKFDEEHPMGVEARRRAELLKKAREEACGIDFASETM